jgi:hypothetical protein
VGKDLSEDVKMFVRASVAENTWKKHNSAWQCVKCYSSTFSIPITMPMNESFICEFAAWALKEKELMPSTVTSYLSSLTTIHELKGFKNHNCLTPLAKKVIQGAQNLRFYTNMVKCTRKVVTLPMLKLIGHEIAKSDWSKNSKQVFWSACVTAFFGSFRLSEILSKSEWNYNETETLLWSDVKFTGPDSVLIHITVEKSRNIKGAFIDLFRFSGHNCCPVSCLKALYDVSNSAVNSNKPVFSFESGKLLIADILVNCVRELLRPHLGDEVEGIFGHSFRAGLPAAMADCPDIANSEDVKSWGRWNSSSFLLYTRLKFHMRRAIFNKIMSIYD